MSHDIVYLPVFHSEKGYSAAGQVFLLTKEGEVHKSIPDHEEGQELILERKYPLTKNGQHNFKFIGGRFQGANKGIFLMPPPYLPTTRKPRRNFVLSPLRIRTSFTTYVI